MQWLTMGKGRWEFLPISCNIICTGTMVQCMLGNKNMRMILAIQYCSKYNNQRYCMTTLLSITECHLSMHTSTTLGKNNSLRPSDAYIFRIYMHHRFGQWLVTWSVLSNYLNQCWNIVNGIAGNNTQWNFNRKSNIFIQEIFSFK